MTTIIGLQYDDKCILVADSQTTDHNGKKYSHPEVVKISEVGPYLIAGSGETQPCDILQHCWEPLIPTAKDRKDIYHFMVSKVSKSMRQCLTDNGFNFDEPKSSDGEPRFTFLVALHGELFELDAEMSIQRMDDGIYGIGGGAPWAVGALHAGADAYEAMEIASKIHAFTAPPYISKEQFKHIK